MWVIQIQVQLSTSDMKHQLYQSDLQLDTIHHGK